MRIFFISPVRRVSEETLELCRAYVENMEAVGHRVHWPIRDTEQVDATGGYRICSDNIAGIRDADEVHVWWDRDSSGEHFDIGAAFALGKPLHIVNPEYLQVVEGQKSFDAMLRHWAGAVVPPAK